MSFDWAQLLDDTRRKKGSGTKTEARRELERDYDRILFSTPLRRLADKTQVFPLERNDSVRTRLTHSHEVSNLARSIGVDLAFNRNAFPGVPNAQRDIPALLAALGLAHDLGNPPFGHQGEKAIQDWFNKHRAKVFPLSANVSVELQQDFLRFEGNAQTFRILTRLQLINDDFGLNLCYATLAGLLKYTVGASEAKKSSQNAGAKKPGFFASESEIVAEVRDRVGLTGAARHPLTYIVEACDDIAYSVIDAEDTVKKGLASYPDLSDYLKSATHEMSDSAEKDTALAVIASVDADRKEWLKSAGGKLSPSELNDLSMQKFRVHAMHGLVAAVTDSFMEQRESIEAGAFKGDLVGSSRGALLIKLLKEFDTRVGYRSRGVLEVELRGYRVIHDLLDSFWLAVTERDEQDVPSSRRSNPRHAYVYGRISENYRRVFEDHNNKLPLRYREAQLLSDMVSGMSDSFAMTLHEELGGLPTA